jgi:hypothetical protein
MKFLKKYFITDYLVFLKVNMREHQITNGVFKIECFERPSQTKEINFELFLRLSEFTTEKFYESLLTDGFR